MPPPPFGQPAMMDPNAVASSAAPGFFAQPVAPGAPFALGSHVPFGGAAPIFGVVGESYLYTFLWILPQSLFVGICRARGLTLVLSVCRAVSL